MCLQGIQTADGPLLSQLSEHRPIQASFLIMGGPKGKSSKHYKTSKWERKPLTVDLKNTKEVELIHAHLTQWLQDNPSDPTRTQVGAGEYLLSLNKAAVAAIVNVKHGGNAYRRKNWKGYKDGWSPTMISIKAQLTALQTMMRHLTGRGDKSLTRWMTLDQASIDIKRITDQW